MDCRNSIRLVPIVHTVSNILNRKEYRLRTVAKTRVKNGRNHYQEF